MLALAHHKTWRISVTNHRTPPVFVIPGLRNGKHLKEQLRLAVEERRDAKGVVERDYE
jgi:hypothetical protein